MGRLLIVTGPPGAGKSTVSRRLADSAERSVLVEGDAFFGFLAAGHVPPWLPGSEAQNDVVVEAAALATGRFTRADYLVVYDGMIGPWYVDRFAAASGATDVHYAILMPGEQTCVDRVAGRVGHGFTDEAGTRTMHAQFAAHPVEARHVLSPPPDDPAAAADAIRERLAAGRLRVTPRSTAP